MRRTILGVGVPLVTLYLLATRYSILDTCYLLGAGTRYEEYLRNGSAVTSRLAGSLETRHCRSWL